MATGQIILALCTIVAIVLGPILAVIITRIIDDRRADKQRKMEIFRTLMRTRKMPIHIEHVGALNLVEIEFSSDDAVVSAWKNYLQNLNERIASTASEAEHRTFAQRRESLLTKLIHEIAKNLNFEVEQLDILEGNYLPQGWSDADWEQKLVRLALLELLQGRRALVIRNYDNLLESSPYPPPPNVKNNG